MKLFSILRRKPLAGVVVMAIMGLFAATVAAASIDNRGFESGDLTGWSTGGGASVVASGWGGYDAPNGNYFAVVESGCSLNHVFQWFDADAGDEISGWAFFTTDDYMPFNDRGVVRIYGDDLELLFFKNVAAVGDGGGTPWTPWSWTAPVDGTFAIRAFSVNHTDCNVSSWVGLDIATSKAEILAGSGVPGKGIDNAPGLQEEFNSKSKAGTNAGKKR